MKLYSLKKRIPLYLIYFLLFFCFATHKIYATDSNVLVNPGFEELDQETVVGWFLSSQCIITDQEKRSDNRCLRIEVTNPQDYNTIARQIFSITPGRSYNYGVWVKAENVEGTGAFISIEFSGNQYQWLGGNWDANRINGTSDWQYIGVVAALVPEEVDGIQVAYCTLHLMLEKGSKGIVWFDDVTMTQYNDPLWESFMLKPNYSNQIMPEIMSPEIKIHFSLNPEPYQRTLSQLGIVAQFQKQIQKVYPLNTEDFTLDLDLPDDLSSDRYELQLTLFESHESNVIEIENISLEKLSSEHLSERISYIDSYNRLILNGQPFFPIGLYIAHWQTDTAQLDDIKNSEFNTLMNYCTPQMNLVDTAKYLQELTARNLYLIFNLHDFIDSSQSNINAITERVTTFKDSNTILAWYLNDELPIQYLSELEKCYALVKSLDKNHPIWSVHWLKNPLFIEKHTTDILGVDPYPIPDKPLTLVSQMADWATEAGFGYRPCWVVPQAHNIGRAPTADEMRAMTYLALNHGAKGLIYYSYNNIKNDQGTYDRWGTIKEIVKEVAYLKPALLSTEIIDQTALACNNSYIDWRVMKKEKQYYLYAVNTTQNQHTGVKFINNMPEKPTTITLCFEDERHIKTTTNSFLDDFSPYQVHVYSWEPDPDFNFTDPEEGKCFIRESLSMESIY